MKKEFKLQDPGEGVHEAEIVEVKVSEGDRVDEGEPVLEIETDKAGVDVPSPFTGTVKKIHVNSGEIVEVGELLITFEVDSEEEADGKDSDKEKKKKTAGANSKRQRKGRKAKKEESDEEDADTSDEKEGKQKKEPDDDEGHAQADKKAQASDTPVPAAPATRRLAREQGVDLRKIDGSGPGGRVTAEDVRQAAEGADKKSKRVDTEKEDKPKKGAGEEGKGRAANGIAAEAPSLPDFSQWGDVERRPLRGIRRATAKQMALAWSQIPHVTHQDVADITELDKFRRQAEGAENASED